MRWLAAGCLLAMTGCGGRNQPNDAALPQCSGLQTVVVTNSWSGAVDISAGDPDNAGLTLLGSVQAGERAEFTLPLGTKRVSMATIRTFQPNIQPSSRPQNMQSMHSLVRFRFVCR